MSSANCVHPGCNQPAHLNKAYCLEHFKEFGDYNYGIDAEIKNKLQAKFSVENAALAQAWLEALTGQQFPGGFQESLKSGVILCRAILRIKPDLALRVHESNMPFKQMENIQNYLNSCKALGMKEVDLFVTKDLYDGDNLVAVIDNIFALGAVARTVGGFNGPFIGVKHADKNVRNFTEEQLAQSRSVMSRQTVGSYGYQDESKNPTVSRQIARNVSGHTASSDPTLLNMGSYGVQPESGALAQDKIIKNADDLAAQRNAAPAQGFRFCGQCGTPRGDGNFCANCGSKYN